MFNNLFGAIHSKVELFNESEKISWIYQLSLFVECIVSYIQSLKKISIIINVTKFETT
jgi:hypothetical protein